MAAKRRILVIDDEVGVARLLKLALEQTGDYEVRVEHTGRRGLLALGEFDPHVVLLDVIMPDMTGQEVMTEIRADPARRGMHVVFLTAAVPREHHDAPEATFEGHPWISKPARAADVIAHIEQALA